MYILNLIYFLLIQSPTLQKKKKILSLWPSHFPLIIFLLFHFTSCSLPLRSGHSHTHTHTRVHTHTLTCTHTQNPSCLFLSFSSKVGGPLWYPSSTRALEVSEKLGARSGRVSVTMEQNTTNLNDRR